MERKVLSVTGTKHYEENILKLMVENPDFKLGPKALKEQYDDADVIPKLIPGYIQVVLEPEPDNQYDPNAVKVLMNGLLVGYVKKESCSQVKELLKKKNFKAEVKSIQIGKFKQINRKSIDIENFAAPFITISMSYEEDPTSEEAVKAPEALKEVPDRAGKVKRMKRSLIIVAVFAWIVASALCHLIEPALVLGIVFIIVMSEIFKRLK